MCKTVMASIHVPFVFGEWNIHPLAYFIGWTLQRGTFHRFAVEQYTTVAISSVMFITNWEMNRFSGNITPEFKLLKTDNNNRHFRQWLAWLFAYILSVTATYTLGWKLYEIQTAEKNDN
jgi:hypothetical protein